MKSVSIAATLAYAGGVAAFWRMPCRSQTGIARIDPLVTPGEIADHVHTITGGGAFGMDTNYTTLTAEGTCTACEVEEDHSAYWTPPLYFQYTNGTTVLVEQEGGMLAYYLYYLDHVQAFPEGFAMIAGNPFLRNFTGPTPDIPLSFWPLIPTDQFWLGQRALGFNCLNYAKTPEPSLYRHTMPSKEHLDTECVDGLRLELAFPSCGKEGEIDSPDHKSHVAYPSLVKEGNCPDDYPVHYPFLFFETIFNTHAFAGQDGEFVLSTGDPVGPSYHGDFIMGWKSADFLQDALDTCKSPTGEIDDCPLFTKQNETVYGECKFEMPQELKDDDVHGPCQDIPVDVPIQRGPEQATPYKVAGDSGVPTTTLAYTAAPSSSVNDLSYSPANPTSTAAAEGGIIEAFKNPGKVHEASLTVDASITQALSSATSTNDQVLSTSTITQGNQVIELVIEATDVTVTVAATPSPAGSKHKRHMERHLHHMH